MINPKLESYSHLPQRSGLLTALSLALALGGCMEGGPDDENDLPVIQDKQIVLIEDGQIDPPVEESDTESVGTAFHQVVGFSFDVTCLDSTDCNGGNCWDFGYNSPNASFGHCEFVVCQEDSDCPTEETCLSGICGNTCNQHSDCQGGQECVTGQCRNMEKGDWDFCVAGGCQRMQGDCDRDSECAGSLICVDDLGVQIGEHPGVDLCLPPAGHASFCTDVFLCSPGQGDCDKHSQCEGLFNICKENIGVQYGFPAWVDVCESIF